MSFASAQKLPGWLPPMSMQCAALKNQQNSWPSQKKGWYAATSS
jgi:hypothetical protein